MNATAAGGGSCTVCKTRGDICAFTEAVPKRRNVRSPGHRVPNEALSSPRLGCFGAIAPENCPRFGDDKTGQLDGWRNNLPSSLQVAYQVISWLCPNGYLHLSFFTVKITLSYRLIRPTALEPLCLGVGILTYTRQMAHETAEAIIAFVSSLRPDHLEAF